MSVCTQEGTTHLTIHVVVTTILGWTSVVYRSVVLNVYSCVAIYMYYSVCTCMCVFQLTVHVCIFYTRVTFTSWNSHPNQSELHTECTFGSLCHLSYSSKLPTLHNTCTVEPHLPDTPEIQPSTIMQTCTSLFRKADTWLGPNTITTDTNSPL